MKFDTDRIVSLSAMVVGIGSLFIIVYQTHLIRQAQNASVLPYLMIGIQWNNVIEITYSSVYGDRWRLRSDRFVPEPF